MSFILLTHSRETTKASNTGQLVVQAIPDTQVIIWQRTQPDKSLLQLIEQGNVALVYPVDNDSDDENAQIQLTDFEYFILIDSTWQEARKIFNRSPYLRALPRVQLSAKSSSYNLRRNQVEGGLCTVECVIELLRGQSCFELADLLDGEYRGFLDRE